jgi:hypothetical protein
VPVNLDINQLLNRLGKFWTIVFIIAIGTGVWFSKGFFVKPKTITQTANCDYLEQQNQMLISALLNIRNTVDSMTDLKIRAAVFTSEDWQPSFASYDTIPKKVVSVKQYQKGIEDILLKLDSILKKAKEDSIKNKQKKKG